MQILHLGTIDVLGWIIPHCGGCPVYYNIPGPVHRMPIAPQPSRVELVVPPPNSTPSSGNLHTVVDQEDRCFRLVMTVNNPFALATMSQALFYTVTHVVMTSFHLYDLPMSFVLFC